jgi:phage shock protein C
MNGHDRRNDWTVVAAIALIGFGVWFLLGNIFGSWWQDAVRQAFRILWPLALIALGVLIYVTAQRGGFRAGASGTRLYRSRRDRMVGGVLAGFGAYFGVDPTILRVLYVIFGILVGVWPAVLAYIIAMIVVPEEPAGGDQEPPVWPATGPGPSAPPAPPSGGGWPHATGTETVQTPPPPPAPGGEEPASQDTPQS